MSLSAPRPPPLPQHHPPTPYSQPVLQLNGGRQFARQAWRWPKVKADRSAMLMAREALDGINSNWGGKIPRSMPVIRCHPGEKQRGVPGTRLPPGAACHRRLSDDSLGFLVYVRPPAHGELFMSLWTVGSASFYHSGVPISVKALVASLARLWV